MLSQRRALIGTAASLLATLSIGQSDTTGFAADTTARDASVPVFSMTQDELDAELGAQDVSGLLQASRDVFTSTAGYNFGQARFRIRGLEAENNVVSINGVMVNNLENGWVPWSQWGGLNDVTRWMEIRSGIAPSPYNFGGIGGWTNIDIRAGSLRKGFRANYAITDRAYRNRVMATYATGRMANGWAFATSGSYRWADEGYVPGTSFSAGSYYLAAEKRLNDRHRLGIAAFGVDVVQGRQGFATQEAMDLTGTHYYNPNWGYQNGEKRNARVSHDHKPMVVLSHDYTPDSVTSWSTSLFCTFGRDGLTALNWYDAKDPRPDYYRYLPSYHSESDPTVATQLTQAWQNDPATSQIDWDQLYFANRKNLYAVHNANGVAGAQVTGNRSKYIVEELRSDPLRAGLFTSRVRSIDARTTLTLGGGAQYERVRNFKVMDDLLGGDFWVDVDQFAEHDFADQGAAQNDLNVPNRIIKEGDTFGYDYDLNLRQAGVFGQLEHDGQHWQTYGALSLAYSDLWRVGHYVNGRFPANSFGASPRQEFVHYGIKGGATYKINGRHYLIANAAWLTRPPTARYAYLSPRTQDGLVDGLEVEKVLSGDVSYQIRAPWLKLRATAYYAAIRDQIWARSFYHDEFRTFVNYTMKGVDEVHTGIEFGAEVKASPTVVITGVLGMGQYLYDSRPYATVTRDNSSEVLAKDREVYWKNFHIGGMPQTAASAGVRYNSPKFWSVGANGNFFGDIYLEPNPDRRTVEATGNLVTDDPQWSRLVDQQKLNDGFTIDAFIMKSWRIKKYRIAANVSVNNLLDEQDLIVAGFEQARYDRGDLDKFPPKYGYLYGRTFFAMITFSF